MSFDDVVPVVGMSLLLIGAIFLIVMLVRDSQKMGALKAQYRYKAVTAGAVKGVCSDIYDEKWAEVITGDPPQVVRVRIDSMKIDQPTVEKKP